MIQVDRYMDRLQAVHNDINRCLRHIRELDKMIEEQMPGLAKRHRDFLGDLHSSREKMKDKVELEKEYYEIIKLQKLYYGMSIQKVKVAEQLKELIRGPLEELKTRLKNEPKTDKPEDEPKDDASFLKKKKNRLQPKQTKVGNPKKEPIGEWVYDDNVPLYCYCGGQSFGEMVFCEYPFCEREWFHSDCLGEKVEKDKQWLCITCRKILANTTNAAVHAYLN